MVAYLHILDITSCRSGQMPYQTPEHTHTKHHTLPKPQTYNKLGGIWNAPSSWNYLLEHQNPALGIKWQLVSYQHLHSDCRPPDASRLPPDWLLAQEGTNSKGNAIDTNEL